MGEQTRVVVTGMGMISPVGNTVEEAWANIIAGRSGTGPITRFDPSDLESRVVGEVKGFNPEEYIPPKEIRRMDRFIQFAIAASSQALTQARYTVTPENAPEMGVIIGSGTGAQAASSRMRAAGWSVALVDHRPFGGTCAPGGR